MARQWRIEYPGALYHVMSRGNGGRDVFGSDDDRHLFLALLGELRERFDIEIHAYVLMGNHYHLLVKTLEANLSKVMQWFGTTFTRKFNIANQAGGHLFQGRFKSIIVQNAAYLLRLSCYIHRNPLRAGLVERLADYPWSSYKNYAYKQKPPSWLTTQLILNELHAQDPHKAYRIKVQQYSDEKGSIWEDVKHGLVYGGQNFVDQIKANYLGDDVDRELPQHNRFFKEFDPQQVLEKVCNVLEFDLETARSTPRITQREKDKRDLLIFLLWQAGRLSGPAIGEYFGLSYSAVSRRVKIMNERILVDPKVNQWYEEIKSIIKV
jgi:REP element-mobilizing transposase RayT